MSRHIYLEPSSGANLEQIQKNSARWKKTKLRGKKPKDLAELISRIIADKEETVYVLKDGSEKTQCTRGRCRSVEDVYRVAKYYKPDITLKEVLLAVKSLYGKYVSNHYCSTVRRIVHNSSSLYNKGDEFRKTIDKLNVEF
jgi:hypothetical protein